MFDFDFCFVYNISMNNLTKSAIKKGLKNGDPAFVKSIISPSKARQMLKFVRAL